MTKGELRSLFVGKMLSEPYDTLSVDTQNFINILFEEVYSEFIESEIILLLDSMPLFDRYNKIFEESAYKTVLDILENSSEEELDNFGKVDNNRAKHMLQ